MDPVELFSRLAHILGAIALFGGSIFIRQVLMPAVSELPEEIHLSFRERLMKKWRMIMGICILVLILSGFYNYLAVTGPAHSDAGDKKYHMFMGIKMLLAFAVFFFASGLAGRSKAMEWMRKNYKTWSLVSILLATAVVGIASFLKLRGIPTPL